MDEETKKALMAAPKWQIILHVINKKWSIGEVFMISQVYALWCRKEMQDFLGYSDFDDSMKAAVRENLQILRDKRYIEFLGRGEYRRLK